MNTTQKKKRDAAYFRRYSQATVDRDVAKNNGGEKRARIDLGLELLALARRPGAAFSQYDIAAWAGCTHGMIDIIERKALKKLANSVRFGRWKGLW